MPIRIEDLTIVQVLSQTRHRIVSRVKETDGLSSFILKMIQDEYPQQKDLSKIKHEFLILEKLKDVKGVIKSVKLIESGNNIAILMEDIDFDSLSEYMSKKVINIDEFLEIAIALCSILGETHINDIVHRNIKPETILYDLSSKEVRIIDFEISSELTHDFQPPKVINSLEGTLAYISPEQTGRMNRPVTTGSDLYSLGVVFYQMLTGHLPFEESDPVSLVYAHIAKTPESPYQVNKNIPPIISEIVMKLLRKRAEDRYRTAFGVKADLVKCQEQYLKFQAVAPFKLAEKDFSARFEIPDKLYGRDQEIKEILSSFEEMCVDHKNRLLLVSGYSGVGKTSLVREVLQLLPKENGLFLEGKIDQYHRDQPYFAISQAFNKYVIMQLSEPNEVLEQWKTKIQEQIGDVVEAVIDLVPRLGDLIKNAPSLTEMNPLETRSRLHLTFSRFIKAITDNNKPLVLFIDDAQWASSSLLDFLYYLLSTDELKNFMLIVGYRDNEVLAGHPLLHFIGEIEKIKLVHNVNVQPLAKDTVNEMISDTLNYSPEQAKELTEVVYAVTEGNPFFLKENLQDLYAKHLLKFSTTKNAWEYDLDGISEQAALSSNVVNFMIKKLEGFPPDTQRILNLAACVGNTFSLEDLSSILNKNLNEMAKLLWEIVKEGVILPFSGDYEHAHEMAREQTEADQEVIYKFQHDRIQQAAYQLFEGKENQQNHYRIGQSLVAKYGEILAEKYAPEIASQFNKALDRAVDKDERNTIIKLNCCAGEAMLDSGAYSAAIEYFSAAKSLLREDHWESSYDLSCKIYTGLAKALLSSSEFEKADKMMESLIHHQKTFIERMETTTLRTMLYSTMGKRNISIPLAIRALAELGISLSEHPSQIALIFELLKIKWFLGRRSISSLVDAPMVTDRSKTLIMELLHQLYHDGVIAGNFPLVGCAILKMVAFSVKYGNFRSTPVCYVVYSGVILGPTEEAREFAELSIAVLEKFDIAEHKCKTYLLYALFSLTFHANWKRKKNAFLKAIKYGIETGDIRYLSYAIDHTTPFDPSFTIPEAIEFDEKYQETLVGTGNREIILLRKFYSHFLSSLIGKTNDRFSLSDSQFDELENLEKLKRLYFHLGPTTYYLLKTILYFLYDSYELALQNLKLVSEDVMAAYFGCLDSIMHRIYKFLIYSSLYETFDVKEKKEALKVMKNQLKLFKKLANHCQDNYIFHVYGMQAELAAIDNQPWGDVISLYDQAIQYAEQYQFINFVAMYSERAAKYTIKQQKKDFSKLYIQKACYFYELYGATEKVKDLKEKYREYVSLKSGLAIRAESDELSLDYRTILKISKSIASEININKLIDTTLRTVAENIGAQYCVLILMEKDQPKIKGIFDVIENKIEILDSQEISEEYLPVKLLNFVVNSGQTLVIDDISNDFEYSQSGYILSHLTKSIICTPIIYQQSMVGVFYGEHRELTGAFTPERLEMLQVLSGQIAISVVNARYIEQMELLYQTTERFVPKPFLALLKKEHIEEIKLGDSVKENISVLFNDIRSFTTLIESRKPEEAFGFVNRYWKFMAPLIRRNRGYIDQYQGDAILAIFPEDPQDAVRAAIEMMSALAEFNIEQKKINDVEISMGIGISTGLAMLGVIGEKERHVAGIISDVANIASRVERLTQIYGAPLLICGETARSIKLHKDFTLRLVDQLILKGKKTVTDVFEVINWNMDGKSISFKDYLDLYNESLSLYFNGQFFEAKKGFEKCLSYRSDKAADVILARCDLFIKEGSPKDWNGAFRMTQK